MFAIDFECPDHAAAIDRLVDETFGPGRFAKTAYRLREGVAPVEALSLVAFMGEGPERRMVGSLRFWPILIGDTPALLLGPLAVEPALRGKGCGIQLMERGLAEAARLGHRLVILVGDVAYYGRVGFARVPAGSLIMPGPVNPARLLYRELAVGALDGVSGAVTPARAI